MVECVAEWSSLEARKVHTLEVDGSNPSSATDSMLSGEFARKLRKLNHNLRVFCGDNPWTPAGIFLLNANSAMGQEQGYEDICGIDKNYVPEHSEWNANGTLRKGGWRRALKLLIQRRLIDRRYAEKLFSTHLGYAPLVPRAKRINAAEQLAAFKSKYGGF